MLKKIIQYLLITALFIPFLFTPFTLYPSYFGKTLIFQLIIEIAFLFYVILLMKGEIKKPKITPFFWLIFIFLAIRIIAGFLGLNPEKSFWGTQARMGGNFTWLHFFIFFFLLTQFFQDKKEWYKLLKIAVLVSFLVALTGIFQRFGIVPERWWPQSSRIYGVIGNSIPFAGYILFSIWLGVLIIYDSFKKNPIFNWKSGFLPILFWGLILAVNIIALFWSGTRGVIYVFLASVPLAFFLFGIFSKKRIIRLIFFSLIFIFLLSSLFIFINRENRIIVYSPTLYKIASLSTIFTQSTLQTRFLNWQIALQGWTETPRSFLIGHGTENYDIIFDKFYNPEFLKHSFYETVGDRPHNLPLEIVNASGIFGLLAYLGIFVGVIWILISNARYHKISKPFAIILSLAFLTYFGQNLFEFDSTNVLILFFLGLGLVSSIYQPRRHQVSSESRGISTTLCVILFMLVCFGIWFGTIQPIKASYYTLKTNDLEYEKADIWGKFAKKALESSSVFHDEIRIHVANSVFDLAALGLFNVSQKNLDALQILHEKLGESIKKHPKIYAYKHRFAQVEAMMGEYIDKKYFDDAEETFQELNFKNPNRQAVGLAWGQMRVIRGDGLGAVEILQEVVDRNPKSGKMHWYLGLALLEAGERERGISELEKSMKLDKSFTNNNHSNIDLIISLWRENGDYEKIVLFYEGQVEGGYEYLQMKNRVNVLVRWLPRLAATYAEMGETEKAIEIIKEAVKFDPSLVEEAREFIQSLEGK